MICDTYGIIQSVTDECKTILGYKENELEGQFMGIIMSPFLSFFHKQYLLPMYRSMSEEQKQVSHTYLSGKKVEEKPLIIYTKSKDPLCVHLNVFHQDDGLFRLVIHDILYMNSNQIYTSDINPPEVSDFVESKNDMVVIGIDMKESTTYLMEHGPSELIRVHIAFHEKIVYLIKSKYYPYLYIHEIMGDGFLLVLNIEWSYQFPRFCASMTYCFLTDLYEITKDLIPFRAGVCYGKLHYGYLDTHLRFFGETIHRASRYESVCKPGSFTSDRIFYEKMVSEGMIVSITHHIETVPLRGLGDQEIFHIKYVDTDSPEFVHKFKVAENVLVKTGTPIIPRRNVSHNSNGSPNSNGSNISPIRTITPYHVSHDVHDLPIVEDMDMYKNSPSTFKITVDRLNSSIALLKNFEY